MEQMLSDVLCISQQISLWRRRRQQGNYLSSLAEAGLAVVWLSKQWLALKLTLLCPIDNHGFNRRYLSLCNLDKLACLLECKPWVCLMILMKVDSEMFRNVGQVIYPGPSVNCINAARSQALAWYVSWSINGDDVSRWVHVLSCGASLHHYKWEYLLLTLFVRDKKYLISIDISSFTFFDRKVEWVRNSFPTWRFPKIGVLWGTPKSSILIGCSLLNPPFGGTPMTLETPKRSSTRAQAQRDGAGSSTSSTQSCLLSIWPLVSDL